MLTHSDTYRKLAAKHHITITNLNLFGIKDIKHLRELIKEDPYLNNISLGVFDSLTWAYNSYHPSSRLSLVQGTCIYKQLLLDIGKEQ